MLSQDLTYHSLTVCCVCMLADQFFCFVAMAAYGVDVFLQVRRIRRQSATSQQHDNQDEPGPV